MLIDRSRFPLVFLRVTASSQTGRPEAELEAILADELPFVLISDQPPHEGDDMRPEEKKARAKFLKRNRSRLLHYCAGAIVIEDAKATPAPLRIAARAFGKAFGVPFHFVPDEATALLVGNQLIMNAHAGMTAHHLRKQGEHLE